MHDGTTRNAWVGSTLVKILEEPQASGNAPPETFARVIRALMDQGDKRDADPGRRKKALRSVLERGSWPVKASKRFMQKTGNATFEAHCDEHGCGSRFPIRTDRFSATGARNNAVT